MLTLTLLKQLFLVFWSLWITIVFVTNIFDALKEMDMIYLRRWHFASGNYRLLVEACRTSYPTSPTWLPAFYYAGVIVWQGLITWLFWSAVYTQSAAFIDAAFVVSLAHWMVFLLADEVYRQWELERAHILLFIAQGVTLFLIYHL